MLSKQIRLHRFRGLGGWQIDVIEVVGVDSDFYAIWGCFYDARDDEKCVRNQWDHYQGELINLVCDKMRSIS